MKARAAVAFVALMLLSSWAPVVGAQGVPLPQVPAVPGAPGVPGLPPGSLPNADPLQRLLGDLQRLLGGQAALPGTPSPPALDPASLGRLANATQADLEEDLANATRGPIQTLFYEGFESSFLDQGWSQEVLRGRAPWGIVDSASNAVVRMDGNAFTPEFEKGEAAIPVKDGTHAATILNPQGRYDGFVDARLLSPVVDLRSVLGASQRTDDPYDLLTKDPTIGAPYQAFFGFWKANLVPFTTSVSGANKPFNGLGWIFETPPSQIQRIYPGVLALDSGLRVTDTFFVNPLAERYGAGLVNLTFYHRYDINPTPTGDPDYSQANIFDAFNALTPEFFGGSFQLNRDDLARPNLDGVFLEARVVKEDGTVGPWEHLHGDSVFEANVNRGIVVPIVLPSPGNTPPVQVFEAPLSGANFPVTGSVETIQGTLAGQNDYMFPQSDYWGRVQLRPYRDCFGTNPGGFIRVDCQPDAPAFVSSSGGQWKSHFTLNRYIGHQVQLAWRVHSGFSSPTADDFGWFVDAVKVEAMLHPRDVSVDEVQQPRPDDLVPTTALLQPRAAVQNHGYQTVEDVRVNFTITEVLPEPDPLSLVQGGQADAGALAREAQRIAQGQPGQVPNPVAPRGLSEAVQGVARQPAVLMRGEVRIPRLEPLQEVLVQSPEACTKCVPGKYMLRVEASLAPLEGSLLSPGRVEDGSPSNNRRNVSFEVRDVAKANVRLTIPASSALSDVNEPKTLNVLLQNLGNLDLTGTVQMRACPLDPRTVRPVAGEGRCFFDQDLGEVVLNSTAYLVGSPLLIGAGDLPAGKRLTSFGSDRDRLEANVTWTPTNLPPGVYLVEARLVADQLLIGAARGRTSAFIRLTPSPVFPGDGRGAEDFEQPRREVDGFDASMPAVSDITTRGWQRDDTGGLFKAAALPIGPVSVNHTWNATASDGAFAEFSVLSLLAGRSIGADLGSQGVPQPGPPVPPVGTQTRLIGAVVVGNGTLDLCTPVDCRPLPLDSVTILEQGDPKGGDLLRGHSFLNDYYLTRTVDLGGCVAPCVPFLSYWHRGNFSWNGTGVEEFDYPDGLGGPLQVPGGIQAVSLDQANETRSRGLVEVTALDGAKVRLPGEFIPRGLPTTTPSDPGLDLCLRSGNTVCDALGPTACVSPDGLPLRIGDVPFPPLADLYAGTFGTGGTCAGEIARAPLGDADQVDAHTQPVKTWERRILNLTGFAGQRVQLAFHFQTALGRYQVNYTSPYCPGGVACINAALDHWVLDNIRVGGLQDGKVVDLQGGFADSVGDRPGDVAYQGWQSLRVLREVVDANVAIDGACLRLLAPIDGSAPDAPGLTSCLADPARFKGNVVAVDGLAMQALGAGRGWERFAHEVPNQIGNPYYDGWFLDADGGFQPPGVSDVGGTRALRWGSPGSGGKYPSYVPHSYNVASTKPFSLAQSAQPTALLQANWSFHPARNGLDGDGATFFLARYIPQCEGDACTLKLDRRVVVKPEGGYPARLEALFANEAFKPGWKLLGGGDNALISRSGEWKQFRFDLVQVLASMCLKEVDHQGVTTILSHEAFLADDCARIGRDHKWSGGGAFNTTTGISYRNLTSFAQDAAASYALEVHTTQQNGIPETPTSSFGMVLDDIRVGEQNFANDLRVSHIVFPPAGKPVGPDQALQVRMNLTNVGHFSQRGVRLHFNVTQQGHQVFPVPETAPVASASATSLTAALAPAARWNPEEWRGARVTITAGTGAGQARSIASNTNDTLFLAVKTPKDSWDPVPDASSTFRVAHPSLAQLTPSSLVIPGLRDANPQKNVSVAFETEWTPPAEGLYTLNAWVEIVGEVVNGELLPLIDENPRDNFFTQPVDVRKVRSVRLLPAAEMPDEQVVRPLVGTASDRRALRVLVENLGTVSEGQQETDAADTDGDGIADVKVPRDLTVTLEIRDEAGALVQDQPNPVQLSLVPPGASIPADFVWVPPSGGLFTLRFRAVSPQDAFPADNGRVVRVLVLTALLPRSVAGWTADFEAAGTGWDNATRQGFRGGEGWSFGSADAYAPLRQGTLTLAGPMDLTAFRNAVLTLRHRYDFERGYDGGVVEVSADGEQWVPVEPTLTFREDDLGSAFQGYPDALTSASAEVLVPGDDVRAFTGDSGGVVTSVIPLGSVPLTRTEPLTLFRDTFDPQPHVLGREVESAAGRWAEVATASEVPTGKAWLANKSLVWRPPPASPDPLDSLPWDYEGYKEIVVGHDGSLVLPGVEASLVVEFDEWRALGLNQRGTVARGERYDIPTSVEVALERTAADGQLLRLAVMPRGGSPSEPYADNYMEWTKRRVVVPSSQLQQFLGQEVRLAFRLNLANSNASSPSFGVEPERSPANGAGRTGGPSDTDMVSPNLGWAIASPRLSLLAPPQACEAAGLRVEAGRCVVFRDPLAYEDGDAARDAGVWGASWRTLRQSNVPSREVTQSSGAPKPGTLFEAGWRLVDAVGLPSDKAVWDTAAYAPPRSGRGRVAEATGAGSEARLVTPLNLRGAASDAVLSMDHSFKFTDLELKLTSPSMILNGTVSGGRVEVSRDGGSTWVPLKPLLDLPLLPNGTVDRKAYHDLLLAEGFRRTYTRGNPTEALGCTHVAAPGCFEAANPYAAPGSGPEGWLADGRDHGFTPLAHVSTHTPFGGAERDPEGDSAFGPAGVAFGGRTCRPPSGPPVAEPTDMCGGPEDWRSLSFDLGPYVGQEVLLGFHAFFGTHRDTAEASRQCYDPASGCTMIDVPRDFWRIDNLTVSGRVLDGKPVYLRLRGFSDGSGQAYGWDVLNVSVFGEKHLANLGARFLGPAAGAPLVGEVASVSAQLVNRGQTPLQAQGLLLIEQEGSPALVNGDFEANVTLPLGWSSTPASSIGTTVVAEGARAVRFSAAAPVADGVPFRLSQDLTIPPGAWRLTGLVDAKTSSAGAAGVRLQGVLDPDGRPDPLLRFPALASPTWRRFSLDFLVLDRPAEATLTFLADRSVFGADFVGDLGIDALRFEPRVAAPFPGLRDPGFEARTLEETGWQASPDTRNLARSAGLAERYKITYEEESLTVPPVSATVAPGKTHTFAVDIAKTNVTTLDFVVKTQPASTATLVPETLNVTVTAPNGTRYQKQVNGAPGVRIVVNNSPLGIPPMPDLLMGIPRLAAVPGVFIVDANSEEDARANTTLPRAFLNGTGTWTVAVRYTAQNPALAALQLDNVVTVQTVANTWKQRVDSLAGPDRLTHILEGSRSLLADGRGLGVDDINLTQSLALPAGKYRLSGLFASRTARIPLAANLPGVYRELPASPAPGSLLEQTLRAQDLPRHMTQVFVVSDTAASSFKVSLLTSSGEVLKQVSGVSLVADDNGQASPIAFDVRIPRGIDDLVLRLENLGASPIKLQVRPGDEYAHGVLRVGSDGDLGEDLRVLFEAPVETNAADEMRFRGGVGASGLHEVLVKESLEWPLRQRIPLEDGVRRITNVTVGVVWPAGPLIRINATLNYSLLQGQLRAQLFDAEGRALSEEAYVVHERATVRADNTAVLPALQAVERFDFTNAFLPAGTDEVFLALRALNFTGAPGAHPLVKLKGAVTPAGETAGLRLRGAPIPFFLDPAGEGAQDDVATCRNNVTSSSSPHGCDILVTLAYAREGLVTIDALGAQGPPVRLGQPTTSPATFDAQKGGVGFAYDFVVPPGQATTTLRVKADQWQGEAILDDFRLIALSPAAAVASGALEPKGTLPLALPDGSAPAIPRVRGATYKLTVEAIALDGDGGPVGELLVGDNRVTLHTGLALGPGRLVVEAIAEPNSINLTRGTAAAVLLRVRNEGATDVELASAEVRLLGRDGSTVLELSHIDIDPAPENLTFAPLEERVLRLPFLPDPSLAHGVYDVEAIVVTQQSGTQPVPESRHRSVVYMGTDFHGHLGYEWPFQNATLVDDLVDYIEGGDQPRFSDRWTSNALHNLNFPKPAFCESVTGNPPPECQPQGGDPQGVTENLNFKWRKTDVLNLSAFKSITLGGDPAFPPSWVPGAQNALAMGTVFATVRTPAIPITDFQTIQLAYADRHNFVRIPGAEGRIAARLLNTSDPDPARWPTFPAGDCLKDNGEPDWVQVDKGINGISNQWNAGKWVQRLVDLAPLVQRAEAEAGGLDAWTHVQVCWYLQQPSANPDAGSTPVLKEWSIDDVLVTPYGMGLGPSQRIPITDNVSKDFRVILRNNGAYSDTYVVRLEDETGVASRGPVNWRLGLRDLEGAPLAEVRLQPGEERQVAIHVEVDVAPATLAREGSLEVALSAISTTTSNLRSTQRLVFDFLYKERPNLRIAGLIVNDATLSVDKPRTIDVLVQNSGGIPALGANVAVFDKMDPAFGVPPEELRRLDGTAPEPFDLAPGDTRVVTVNWVPRLDGEHNITAIADPLERLLEFNEKDNTLVKPILVPKAEFPDLLVEATASTTNPSPGDLVEISARITNKGGASAQGVQVSVRAGVTDLLQGEPPHILPNAIRPGETVLLNATWRPPFPGEQTIIVRAKTFAGVLERLDTSGDNVQLLTIRVRSKGLDISLPQDLTVQPGKVANATITVHNRGDIDDAYRLTLEGPEDWRALFLGRGEETVLAVRNHSSADLQLQLGPPAHAEAGPYPIRIHARSENGTEALVAELIASVPQEFGIRFTLEPEHLLLPGKRFLPLLLQNGGNGLDLVTVRARVLPPGWSLEAQTIPVGPLAKVEARVLLSSPGNTPEGSYAITLEAQGRGGDLLAQSAKVQILPHEELGLDVQGIPAVLIPGQAVQGALVVRNLGNLAARADLVVRGPQGWPLRLERDVVAVNPGEARSLTLGLTVPSNATAKSVVLIANATSARAHTYLLEERVRPARADLAIVNLEQLQKGQVRDGGLTTLVATIANQGEVDLTAPLAVYVDDALLGFEPATSIPAGAEAKVNVSFKARGGEHVILVVVDPGQVIGEEDETDNARVLVQRVDRAAGLFAVPGPEPLLAFALIALGATALRRKRVPR